MSVLFTTLYIGPVQAPTRELDPAWTSTPDAKGFRGASIKAALPIAQAEQLSELIANSALRQTIGGASGVPVDVWSDGFITRGFNGSYLLQGLSFEPYGTGEWVSHVPVTISALHLGQRRRVVEHSDRALPNSYGVTAQASIADPYPMADSIVASPGGTRRLVEFDPEPHDAARVTVMAAEMAVYTAGVGVLDLVTPLAPGF